MNSRRQTARSSDERLLDDPALKEALRFAANSGRLSNEQIRAMRANRRRAVATAALTVALLAAGVGGWRYMRPAPEKPDVVELATAPGQTREFRAGDGTVLRLNGATRVTLTFDSNHRDAELASGEAFFDVAHDERRPFTVHAGKAETTVLGTAFDLDLTERRVGLSVYRGAVRFTNVDTPSQAVVVKAGWRTQLRDGQIAAVEPFDTTQADWRQGWIDTKGITLADLVEVLGRQGGRPVEAPPAALGDMEISGRFRVDQPYQLLSSLGEAYGFRVRQGKNRIAIESDGAD